MARTTYLGISRAATAPIPGERTLQCVHSAANTRPDKDDSMAANQQETNEACASGSSVAAISPRHGGLSYPGNCRFCHQLGLIAVLAALAWVPLPCCSAVGQDEPLRSEIRRVPIGENEIGVAITEKPGSPYVFVNLHDDESMSVEAAQDVLNRSGGRLVELRHTGKRLVVFKLKGREFRVDPNRIFTPAGARKTLERQSTYSNEAAVAVKRFAEELLNIYRIDRAAAVIALHNNTPGTYSALSYAAGGIYAHDAEDVFVRDGSDLDDFFFVTERAVFDALKRKGYNVVLQDNRQVTDDGSLSVYCGKSNVRYVNVEADHGHRKEQTQMLLDLKLILDELGPAKPH
jgi:hypothetical protein